jgi:hypothetical protein
MNLEAILADPPRVHGGGTLFKLGSAALRLIDATVTEQSRTLETGAGISTILFALRHTEHTSVVPYAEEADRIRAYCVENGIQIDKLRFEIGRSEEVLPRLAPSGLDLVLIDGRHGFPTPFIDWYYTAEALRIGGLLVVDDTQLWTGEVLKKFLQAEPEWRLEHDFHPQTCVFRKLADGSSSKSWTEQEFLVRKTAHLARLNRLRSRVGRVRRAATLVRGGHFGEIARKVFGVRSA